MLNPLNTTKPEKSSGNAQIPTDPILCNNDPTAGEHYVTKPNSDLTQESGKCYIGNISNIVTQVTQVTECNTQCPTAVWLRAPLQQFIQFAAREAIHEAIDNKGDWENKWKGPIFRFAFLLRSHPEMQPFLDTPGAALRKVEELMAERGGRVQRDPWKDWFDIERIEAVEEFIHHWRNIRFRLGYGPLDEAVAAARKIPLPTDRPEDAPEDRERSYTFFVSIAGHLQRLVGDTDIALPCRKLAEIMHVSPMQIHRYIKAAEASGILWLTKPHKYNPERPNAARAALYRFDVDRFFK